MSNPQPAQAGAGPGSAGQRPKLPDLNAGPYPFEVVQAAVDRAACFVLYAAPAPGPRAGPDRHVLRRLDVHLQGPSAATGLRAENLLAEPLGELDLRLAAMADDADPRPGAPLAVEELDPGSSQRVVLRSARFRFGDGSAFTGFGTGRTFPFEGPEGRQVVVAAVGAVLDPAGALSGTEGNFVLSGTYHPADGFRGNVTLRVVDAEGRLRTAEPVPGGGGGEPLPAGHTYLLMRAQKKGPGQKSRFSLTPEGGVRGIDVPLELTRVEISSTVEGGLRSRTVVGEAIGREVGFTAINPVAPSPFPGTSESPIRFQGASKYTYFDASGTVVGGCQANFLEGRSFKMQLGGAPGLPALRFGYFGPLSRGTGSFEGARGILYGVAGVGLGPHVFSNLYIAHLLDPRGRFRAGGS